MGRKKRTPKERIRHFWERVDTSAGPDGCWPHAGKPHANGYVPVLWDGNRYELAHRIAYELTHHAEPDGLNVLHTCDNRRCVNPRHLYLGTDKDRAALMVARGRNKVFYGDDNPTAKLSDAQTNEIRRRYAAGGVTQAALADEYGVHYSHISLIVNGKRRQHAA